MEEDNKSLPEDVAEPGLFLCDCINHSAQVDPSFHLWQCSYRIWYYQTLRERQGNQQKDQ